MSLYEKILNREEKIALIGLGYVGMPIAVAFAEKVDVIGFDINKKRLNCINPVSILRTKSVMMQLRLAQLISLATKIASKKQNLL